MKLKQQPGYWLKLTGVGLSSESSESCWPSNLSESVVMHRLWRRIPTAAAAAAATVALGSSQHRLDALCTGSASSSPNTSAPSQTKPPHSVSAPSGSANGLIGAIGDTPLIYIPSLSEATGCRILAKAEHLQPGGSVKDRAASFIIDEAERVGALTPRHARSASAPKGIIVEGTGGNTGIALALCAAARGYDAIFTMPANVSAEKVATARALGARVIVCPVVAFDSPLHYYHVAEKLARETPHAVWGNQFEGLANSDAHIATTGPEIWKQTGGHVDALALSAGTGGTIGGISTYMKVQNPAVRVFLVDPPGSSLAGYVKNGVMAPLVQGSTITEGIGIGRLTANFDRAIVDDCFTVQDQEVVDMGWYMLRREGLWIGPSAALNLAGAVKAARVLGPGHTLVTVLCDGGARYASKMYDDGWLKERGLHVSANPELLDLSFVL